MSWSVLGAVAAAEVVRVLVYVTLSFDITRILVVHMLAFPLSSRISRPLTFLYVGVGPPASLGVRRQQPLRSALLPLVPMPLFVSW